MPVDDDTFKNSSLRCAAVDGWTKVFALGPFGPRVSFASQQWRALNLVWALETEGIIQPGHDIAIVGAGLAGITAAAALTARKCSVYLYETSNRVLSLQRATTHREIHPTVNFWPEEDCIPTTDFPFLNWHQDSCILVIESLFDEWNKRIAGHVPDPFLRSTVKRVIEIDNKVTIEATGRAPATKQYDAALVATGFGTEIEVDGADNISYWNDADPISGLEGTIPELVVGGIGDGGLIEALRAVC